MQEYRVKALYSVARNETYPKFVSITKGSRGRRNDRPKHQVGSTPTVTTKLGTRMWNVLKEIFSPGDKRVIYKWCNHCRGRGCVFFTKEQLDEGVDSLVSVTMDAKVSACLASVDSKHRHMVKQPWFKKLKALIKYQEEQRNGTVTNTQERKSISTKGR
jgi:hypothetical protein